MTLFHTETDPGPEVLYLEMMKRFLTRYGFEERYRPVDFPRGGPTGLVFRCLTRFLDIKDLALVHQVQHLNLEARSEGHDLPGGGETMVGLRRLDNLQECIADVIRHKVPGDLIETGVWRGGATIFMRAVLKAYGVDDRNVWVADSFEGLPRPRSSAAADAGDRHWRSTRLAVSQKEVKSNFARYDLLDEQVHFLPGWFEQTLPTAPIEHLAVARLDGDMYDSTMVALRSLYPKISPGGFLIVDDYGAVPGCRTAVEDYRLEMGITESVHKIDWSGAFWQKQT